MNQVNQSIQVATTGLPLVGHASDVGRRIRDALNSPSGNDRAIAAVILRDPFVAAFSTVEQIAAAAGVSKAAVARFGMRLGYAGYAELRQDLRNRWQERAETVREPTDAPEVSPDLEPSTAATLVRSILTTRLGQEVTSLSRLVDSIDPAGLLRCAEMLARPGARIHVLGERRGYAVAAHALRTMRWLGCDARMFSTDELGLRLALDQLAARHILVAFAFRRYAHTTGVVLQHARERGVAIILITDSLDCPFLADADEVVVCASAGNLLIDSSVPAVFCFEALCDLVIDRLGDRVDRHVRRVHEQTRLADFDDAERTAELLRTRPRRSSGGPLQRTTVRRKSR